MRAWHSIALLVCATLSAGVIWQGQRLRSESVGTGAPADSSPNERVEVAPEATDESPRDLARLRNEVTQLRARKSELEAARREHAALLKATNESIIVPREPPPGFVSKDKLSNAGYASPEDALQTLFWAMREGNFSAIMGSYAPGSAARRSFEQMPPERRNAMEKDFMGKERDAVLAHLNDVGIRSREVAANDTMILHVGSSLSTNTVKMRMQRTAEGWKFDD